MIRKILIGLALLVILGGAVACSAKPGSVTTPTVTTPPSNPTSTPTPVPSRQKVYGLRIAFMSKGSIYIVNPGGTQRIELGEGSEPVWSPDGKKTAYKRSVYKNFYGQQLKEAELILVMDSDGTSEVEIARDEELRFIGWALDSGKIAYIAS